MTMNRILKIVYTMACLLTATGAWADGYKIRLNAPSNGTMTSSVAEASPGTTVTITVSPTGDYYLSALYYEKIVTDMGGAESPRRRSPGFSEETYSPGFSEKTDIPINTTDQTYRSNHYGGTYTISMPSYDIEVTAEFTSCTPITGATLHWDSNSSSINITYDHGDHTANVYLGSSDLTVDANYTITTNKQTDVGSITPTITGVGTYCGTINNQTISITTKTLNIAAVEGQSKVYGASDPVFTYTYSGLCSDDQITGALGRAAGENVGSYAINIGNLTAGSNYNIAFTSKNFTINPKDLSAVALTISLDYDFFNDNDGVQKAEISTITYGNTTLTQGEGNDYTYAYGTGVYTHGTDYTTPDIYPINITFSGNYAGTKTVKYQIRPQVLLNNSDFRWRTFYEPTYNMMVPTGASGFQAYTVSDVNVYAVEVTDRQYIKAGVPMLLYKPGANYQFYPELVEPTDGHLSGWSASGYYKQNASDWDLGTDPNILNETKKVWVLVRDKFVRSMSGTLKANKCYLELSGPTPVSFSPELNLNPILTGIETPKESRNDKRVVSEWYTLDGRKIQGIPSKKGIYITNGKKIIIK